MRAGSRAADEQSALALFLELLHIDSPSGGEQRAARFCAAWLEDLGLSVDWEPVAVGDTVSANLWARAPGDSTLSPVLVCAHLDTRWAGVPDVRRRADGWIESGNDVPLGADDKAGVAAVMAGLARVVQDGRRHPPIEILFSVGEELGSAGVRASRRISSRARRALVVDAEAPVGTLAEAGYGQARLWLGYSARGEADRFSVWRTLQEAAKRIGPGLTGELVRFLSSEVGFEAELAVWFSPDVAWRIAKARYDSWLAELERSTAPREVRSDLLYPAYDVRSSPWLHDVRRRMEREATPILCARMRDGCDANWLASMGLLPVNVGVGYERAHTRAERIHETSLARLTRLLMAALSEP
ncbi:M20/M25/M40 family metallo-hydrolase [Alicyclobacillus acidocaldarius]|uniref:Peptidase M20 n=1 Tax=Alicyclobacillus acidocaldarius (strain Tc-4-1) TaxID=1048834 RepID=F8IKK5_ALIAT|nr:M20/M25/M40 family metallo-hydrolase [Alicyclobacillus acidocaldarius]AEJ43583.1 peptidase M20 [Alicyclobacillus acidocaldarius subsp. acidocaldarius Tc-4-1]